MYAALIATAALSGPAMADALTPSSYSFDQATGQGTWSYPDASFTKLTDGVLGNAGWGHNEGSEWAGWSSKSLVNIDFVFSSFVNVASITFYSAQDRLDDVVLPSLSVFSSTDGLTWVLQGGLETPPNPANNNHYQSGGPATELVIGGLDFVSRYVRVAATSNGPWIFASEVTFDGSAVAVPGPEAGAGLGALALGGMALYMKRRRKNEVIA